MKRIVPYIITLIVIGSVFQHCDKSSSLSVNSTSSQTTTGVGGSMARYTILGDYLYTVDNSNLNVFDITDGANPVLKNTVKIGFSIETIYPFKDKLFIGSSSQVYIYSVANPANPKQLGSAISPQVLRRCDPVVAKDTVAFATLRTNGVCGGTQSILAVYDIKDINNPVQKATLNMDEPYGLGYADTVLYVCNGSNGLKVVSVANPYSPYVLKTITGGITFTDVIPYGNILICWVSDGVVLYDISKNNNPVLITKIN